MTATRGKGATKATRTEEASGEQLKSKSRLQGGVAKSKDAAKTPDRDAKKKKKGFLGGLFGKKGKKPKEKMTTPTKGRRGSKQDLNTQGSI